jgi:hypothetical protein
MAGHVTHIKEHMCRVLNRKPEGKIPLGRPIYIG